VDRHAVPVLSGGSANGVDTVQLQATCNAGETSGSPTFSWQSGNTGVVTTDGSASADSTITGVAAGSTNVNATCTIAAETSAAYSYSITAQQPTSIEENGNPQWEESSCGQSECGVSQYIEWQVYGQDHNAIQFSGMQLWDTLAPTSPNGFSLAANQGTTCGKDSECGATTDDLGTWQDHISICSTFCFTGGACSTGPQSNGAWVWYVNGIEVATKTISFECNQVSF
jgi:hypothetical protein